MCAGAVGGALANAAMLMAPGPWAAIGLRFLTGVALAGVYPPAMKMAASRVGSERGLALGLLIGALTLGKAVPYLMTTLFGDDWRLPLMVASALSLAGGVLVFLVARDGPYLAPSRRFDPHAIRRLLRIRGVRLAIAGYLGHMWEPYAMWTWAGVFATASFTAAGLGPSAATLHGGGIEQGTETIARFVARKTGASLYTYAGRLPRGNLRLHRPSPYHESELTAALRRFLDHVQLAISIHGHGRAEETVFLGGLNYALAARLAEIGRGALPRYGWITDPLAVPLGLRGRHPRNAVNLPPDRGVQIELPRSLRGTRTGAEGRPPEPLGDALVFAQVLSQLVEEATATLGKRS